MAQRIHAPKHLTPRSRKLYATVCRDYGLAEEPHALETLRLALEALDRADAARERVQAEGLTTTNRFGELRPHPCVAIERDSRLAAWRGFRELSLDGGEYLDPRMPRVGGGRS